MKIAHIIPSFYPAYIYGGPIESTYQLCRHLALDGCHVRVLTTDANGPDEVLNVEKDREVKMNDGFYVRYCKRLVRHTISLTFLRLLLSYINWADVVHLTAVYSFPTIPTLFACKILDKPVVWSARGALQRWEGSTRLEIKSVWEWVCRMILPRKIVLHVTSEEEARESLERLPGINEAVIPNGVEIPERTTYVSNDGAFRMLYLGRLHPIKGIENLLVACNLLRGASSIPWFLTIAGIGEAHYTETIQSLIQEMGLSQQVKMVGKAIDDAKERLFENADIVVVPSNKENFGIVVAEALARGVPVIASKGTPWRRLGEIGCGLWVDNDPKSLVMAIEQISKMPLTEMGRRGRDWIRSEFDWPIVAEKMVRVYQSLMIDAE